MSKSRSIVVFGSLGLVLLVALTWVLVLSSRMAVAGDLNLQRESLEQSNVSTAQRIAELEQKKEGIGATKAEAEVLTNRFPATAAQSELFALVRQAADAAGLKEGSVTDLSAGVPVLGGSMDGSVTLADPAAAAGDPAAASDPAAETVPAGAPVTTPAPPVSQLGTMSLDMTVTANPTQITAFLEALENMDRAYLVTSVTLGGDSEKSSASITGNMYLLPSLVDPTAPVPTTPVPPATTGEVPVPTVPGSPVVTDAPVAADVPVSPTP
jgi:hypothetical protein